MRPTTEHRRTSHHLLNRWWFGEEGIDWSNRSSRNTMMNVSQSILLFHVLVCSSSSTTSSIAEVLSIDRTSRRWKSNGIIRREENHLSQSIRSRSREESVVLLPCSSLSIGRTGDGCHRSIPRLTRWCDRRDSRTIRDEENREEIFHRALDWAVLPFNWHRILENVWSIVNDERSFLSSSSEEDREKIRSFFEFVQFDRFGRRISWELFYRRLSTTLGKETFVDLFNRQKRGLIDPAIPSIQLHSPSMKTFADMLNQESFKELLLLPGLSSVVQLEILVIIAQTLLPILHKIKQLTIKEVKEHISISFIAHWRSTSQKRMGISSPPNSPRRCNALFSLGWDPKYPKHDWSLLSPSQFFFSLCFSVGVMSKSTIGPRRETLAELSRSTRTDDQWTVRRRWTFLSDHTRLDPEEIHRSGLDRLTWVLEERVVFVRRCSFDLRKATGVFVRHVSRCFRLMNIATSDSQYSVQRQDAADKRTSPATGWERSRSPSCRWKGTDLRSSRLFSFLRVKSLVEKNSNDRMFRWRMSRPTAQFNEEVCRIFDLFTELKIVISKRQTQFFEGFLANWIQSMIDVEKRQTALRFVMFTMKNDQLRIKIRRVLIGFKCQAHERKRFLWRHEVLFSWSIVMLFVNTSKKNRNNRIDQHRFWTSHVDQERSFPSPHRWSSEWKDHSSKVNLTILDGKKNLPDWNISINLLKLVACW